MPTTLATASPAWAISDYLEVHDGQLTINGANATQLIEKFDSPLFVFSEPRIKSNIRRLTDAASSVDHPIRFFYASKANSNMAVLKTVLESGIDVEVMIRALTRPPALVLRRLGVGRKLRASARPLDVVRDAE